MLGKLSILMVRRRGLVLLIALFCCVLAGALGGKVGSRLSAGGYEVPDAESTAAENALANRFSAGELNLVMVVSTPAGPDSPRTVRAGIGLTRALARESGVQEVVSYWSLHRTPSLRSANGGSALVMAHLGGTGDQAGKTLAKLLPHYEKGFDGLAIKVGGQAEADRELTSQTQHDLTRAEILVIPLTLILLIFVFRGVIAALLPLALGIVAILCTLAALRCLVAFTSISVYAMNLTTALGFGLGIDYSLFVVNRFREELAKGSAVDQAIAASLRTAGRTVLFSALTVSLSLSALLVFPMYFLRSFAYAGIPVVLAAALAAITVLPALLAVLGHRVNKWAILARPQKSAGNGFWHHLALLVMRWPVPMGAAVVALLLFLGTPFLSIKFGLTDERGLPSRAQAHQVFDILQKDYPAQDAEPVLVVASGIGDPRREQAAIGTYAARLSRLPDVASVAALTGTYVAGRQTAPANQLSLRFTSRDGTWLAVVSTAEAYGNGGQHLVTAVRAAKRPFPAEVGGQAAVFKDTMAALGHRLPYALALIAMSTFLLLLLLTGSVVMPLKALVLNLLSLSATFGAMVWIFQEGHLRWLTGNFTVTGSIAATMPIMIFCVAFGLSMDYEVFLLCRIKEEYDKSGGDNVRAVARGLERTGGLVTAAAMLVALVFVSFVTSGVTYMKLLGCGLALAVVMDATLVRGVLVPAFMRLAGRFNWWSPGPLARLHERAGLHEGTALPEAQTLPDGLETTGSGDYRNTALRPD